MKSNIRAAADALVRFYASYGYRLRVTSTDRSFEEQDKLYRAGKTLLRGGQSLHNYGRAFDVNVGSPWPDVTRAESYRHIAHVGRLLGLEAVIERDHVHFEA